MSSEWYGCKLQSYWCTNAYNQHKCSSLMKLSDAMLVSLSKFRWPVSILICKKTAKKQKKTRKKTSELNVKQYCTMLKLNLSLIRIIYKTSYASLPTNNNSVLLKRPNRKHSQQHVAGVGWPCCSQIHSRPYPLCTYQTVAKWGPIRDSEERQSWNFVSGCTTMVNISNPFRFLAPRIEEKPYVFK